MQNKRLRILKAAAEREETGKTFTPGELANDTGIPWSEVCAYASRYWGEGVVTDGLFEPASGTRFGGTPLSSEKEQVCRLSNGAAQQYLEWTALQEARADSRTALWVASISILIGVAGLFLC